MVDLPPPYDEVPLLPNERPRNAFAPIQTQPSAPAWEVHNSLRVALPPIEVRSVNTKCACACLCVTCKWKPCTCHGELLCFNCLVFLGYSLFCLPAVYCCKYGKTVCFDRYTQCPNRRWSLHRDRMNSGAFHRAAWLITAPFFCFICEDDQEVCPYAAGCEDRFGFAHCWPKMRFSLKCKSVESFRLNCTENPEEGSDDQCTENCGCFYGEDESEDQPHP